MVNPLKNVSKFTAEQNQVNADFAESLLKFKSETAEIPGVRETLDKLKVDYEEYKIATETKINESNQIF